MDEIVELKAMIFDLIVARDSRAGEAQRINARINQLTNKLNMLQKDKQCSSGSAVELS